MGKKLTFTAVIPKPGSGESWKTQGSLRQEVEEHFPGRMVRITVHAVGKQRSTQQNRYWWGVIIPRVLEGLNNAWGATLSHGIASHREEVHRFLLRKLWADDNVVADPETGEVMFVQPVSITSLTTAEQEDLNERVRKWAFEHLGITILKPNEQAEIYH